MNPKPEVFIITNATSVSYDPREIGHDVRMILPETPIFGTQEEAEKWIAASPYPSVWKCLRLAVGEKTPPHPTRK